MNLNIYKILLLLPALAIMACSDKSSSGRTSDSQCKSVYLKINANGQTRAVEPTATGTTAALYTALVYFVGGETDPIIHTVLTAGPDDQDITIAELEAGYLVEDVASTVTQVYIIGNYNSIDQDGNGPEFPTSTGGRLSTVKNVLMDIQQVSYPALSGGITSTTLLTMMDGQETLQSYTANPDDWTGTAQPEAGDMYASVTISPLVARIEVESINYIGDEYATMTLAGIFINNYYQQLPVSLDNNDYAPMNNGSNVNLYDDTNAAFAYSYYTTLYDAPNASVITPAAGRLAPAAGNVWAYQVFGNSSPVPHIILRFTDITTTAGATIEDLYVTVTGFARSGSALSTLERNTIYKISAINFDDDDLGLVPEPETIRVWVNVDVEPWTTVNVSPIL